MPLPKLRSRRLLAESDYGRSRGEVVFFGDLRSPFVVYVAINEFGGSRRADRNDFWLDFIDYDEGASKLIV